METTQGLFLPYLIQTGVAISNHIPTKKIMAVEIKLIQKIVKKMTKHNFWRANRVFLNKNTGESMLLNLYLNIILNNKT